MPQFLRGGFLLSLVLVVLAWRGDNDARRGEGGSEIVAQNRSQTRQTELKVSRPDQVCTKPTFTHCLAQLPPPTSARLLFQPHHTIKLSSRGTELLATAPESVTVHARVSEYFAADFVSLFSPPRGVP